MKPENDEKPAEATRRSTSNSYLVRVWQEHGGGADLRFYLRDLKTGEERYLSDSGRISELLIRGLEAGKPGRTRREETA